MVRHKRCGNRLKRSLRKKDINYRSFQTKYPKHAEELARQLCSLHKNTMEAIIVVGGDGTLHEVVNGLVDYPTVKIGFIPAGSANDFSRGFQTPKSPLEALSFTMKKKQSSGKRFDIGKVMVNGQRKKEYFVNNIGAGFDAEVCKLTNESKMKNYFNKIGLGSLAYVGSLIRLLFTYKLTNVNIEMDGKICRYEKVWFVTVSNQPFFGGGMKIAPKADPTDGCLDVTIVHNLSRLKLLFVFITVFFGKHTRFKEVVQYKGKRVSIKSDDNMLVHADGELIGQLPIEAEVQHRKICFLV